MAATQCIEASRCGKDDLLKFKQSIRMGKKGDLSDFERGMVFGARRAGLSISKTADLLGFSSTTISRVFPNIQWVAVVWTEMPCWCQRRMGRLHHHHPEPLRQGRMDPCFHVLYTKFWPYHLNVAAESETRQTRQHFLIFYCPILVSLCEL